MNKKLVAIYGGSFNPPTIAHEKIAEDILLLEEVKKVVYLPVGDSYKKQDLISSKYREDMLCILSNDLSQKGLNVEVNSLEIKAQRRLYTLESLRILREQYDSELAFVMGTDNIKQFDTWYETEKLLNEFYFIVIERADDNVIEIIRNHKLLSNYENKFIILKETSYKRISSTYVRKNLYKDADVSKYINQNVLKYIKNNNLYKGGELL